jgi:hypothetical protein
VIDQFLGKLLDTALAEASRAKLKSAVTGRRLIFKMPTDILLI